MSTGIIYLATGPRHLARLLVSIDSMRNHYRGPVTILCGRDESEPVCRQIAACYQVGVKRFNEAGDYRHATYVTKARLPLESPYDETIYLDSDTLIAADPLELLGDEPLTITRYSDWQTQGRIIGSRVRQWEAVSKLARHLANRQTSRSYPALNTGVIAWRRGWQWQALWQALCEAGRKCSFTDELAMQIMLSVMPEASYRLLGSEWNCSPINRAGEKHPKIWHFHGSKHLKRKEGEELWWPAFQKLYANDVAGVRKWAGTFGDKDLRKRLAA